VLFRSGIASLAVDVSSPDDNASMVAEAERLFGGLHAAVLNAAVMGGGSIDDLSFEDFQKIISVNLFGAVLGIKAALPALRQAGGGAIAITSSTMGIGGESENWAYCASKHAVIGMVRALSREVGWENIRLNALCPGPVRGTGMTSFVEQMAPEHYQMMASKVPLQRWAAPDEMASVLEFLISPASSYVNGHVMVADGGTVNGTGLTGPKTGPTKVMPEKD
jgi:NAD(P)-dependent dehydrogenase (short-subunit alcohol dehydrogenase family)